MSSTSSKEAQRIVENFALSEVLRSSDHEVVFYGKSRDREGQTRALPCAHQALPAVCRCKGGGREEKAFGSANKDAE